MYADIGSNNIGPNRNETLNQRDDARGNGRPGAPNSLMTLMSRIAKEKQSVTSLQRGSKYGNYGIGSVGRDDGSRIHIAERASSTLELDRNSLSSKSDSINGRKLLDRLLHRSTGLSSPSSSSSPSSLNFITKRDDIIAVRSDQPGNTAVASQLPVTTTKPRLPYAQPCAQNTTSTDISGQTARVGTSASSNSGSHNIFEAISHLPTIFKRVSSTASLHSTSQPQPTPSITNRVIDLVDSDEDEDDSTLPWSASRYDKPEGTKPAHTTILAHREGMEVEQEDESWSASLTPVHAEQEGSGTSSSVGDSIQEEKELDQVLDTTGNKRGEDVSETSSESGTASIESGRSSGDDESSQSSPSPAHTSFPNAPRSTDAVPQLHDHNHKAFRIPASLEEWKAGAALSPEVTTVAASAPSSSSPAATVQDDISLFKSIQSRHIQPKPSTTIMSKLPEPSQLRKAAKSSRKVLTKLQKKRLAEGRLFGQAAKRLRVEETISDDNQRKDGAGSVLRLQASGSGEHVKAAKKTYSSVAITSASNRPPPLAKDRIVIQYTVFRTPRLPPSFDGDMMGKIVRGKAFADKNEANRHAAKMMPRAGPSVTRIELDYGAQDAERDGMFFGRAHYKSGEVVFVYVERETQQFGNMDPDEYSGRPMTTEYRDLVLLPRYDVFVFLRKALDGQDGGYVVYEYDEEEPARKEEAEEEGSEDEDEDEDEDDDGEGDDDAAAMGNLDRENSQTQDNGQHEKMDDDGQKPESEGERNGEISGSSTANSTQVVCPATATESADATSSSLGTHFVPVYEGSFSTVAAANAQAVDAFARWTRPQPPARLDALVYYRDILQPYIVELRQQLIGNTDGTDGTDDIDYRGEDRAEISWAPGPQLRYDYEEISVVVVRSQLEGPLDLTGAFHRRERGAHEGSSGIPVD